MLTLWRGGTQDNVQVARSAGLDDLQSVEALLRLFEGIAFEEGWQPGGAIRLWKGRSIYFVLEVDGHLAGGLQLVQAAPSSQSPTLPCQSVWPEVSIFENAAHIAILALMEQHRGQEQGLLFWRLGVEMWRWCVGEGIGTLYIEVTPRVLPIYQRLGWPLRICGEKRLHWGEDCYLCTLGIPAVAETILRRAENSSYYRQIVAQAFRVALPADPGQIRETRESYAWESL